MRRPVAVFYRYALETATGRHAKKGIPPCDGGLERRTSRLTLRERASSLFSRRAYNSRGRLEAANGGLRRSNNQPTRCDLCQATPRCKFPSDPQETCGPTNQQSSLAAVFLRRRRKIVASCFLGCLTGGRWRRRSRAASAEKLPTLVHLPLRCEAPQFGDRKYLWLFGRCWRCHS
jgi:hypothetical protein